MEATKAVRRGGLDWNVPREGKASEAYEVALTAGVLHQSRPPSAEDGMGGLSYASAARHATRLHVISGLLHRIAERLCNEDLTCRECQGEGEAATDEANGTRHIGPCRACAGHGSTVGRRLESLRQDALEIARHYGLTVYFQGDPRGCSLYLIDPAIVPGVVEGLVHGTTPEMRQEQARWLDANHNRGHAVSRLGR